MKNKRGFTLLEVLAVIVVLAVIALITIPIVTGVMKDAKRNSFKTSMDNMVKAANNYYADNQLSIDKVMTFCFGLTGSNCTTEKLKFSGKEPEKGKLIINPDGEISLMDLSNGTYYANYDSSIDDEIVITEDNQVLNRDELTQALKDLQKKLSDTEISLKAELASTKKQLQDKDAALQTQLTSTTTIANTANSTANSLNTGMLNKTYPVGSIYISYSSTNPKSLFGGTWIAYGTGRTLVGMDTSNANFNTIGKTGGSSSKSLTIANLPSHNHTVVPSGTVSSTFRGTAVNTSTNGDHSHNTTSPYPAISSGSTYGHVLGQSWIFDKVVNTMTTNGNHSHTVTAAGTVSSSFSGNNVGTSSVGSGTAINTQDPYITVYMWRRTA